MPDENEFVERPALLFRAGFYPKKGNLRVTVADLEKIAAGTTEAPVQVGHVEEEFKLGTVRNLLVKGQELWGTLRLHKAADALCQINNNLRTISAGVFRNFSGLKEVSVTGKPAIVGAQMFNDTTTADDDAFTFALGEEEPEPMPEEKPVVTVAQFTELQAAQQQSADTITRLTAALAERDKRIDSVQFTLRETEAKAKVATFSNKIPPAVQPKAIVLLMTESVVTFSDTETSVAALFTDILEALPAAFAPGIKGSLPGAKESKEEAVAMFSEMGLSPDAAELAAVEYVKMKEAK